MLRFSGLREASWSQIGARVILVRAPTLLARLVVALSGHDHFPLDEWVDSAAESDGSKVVRAGARA